MNLQMLKARKGLQVHKNGSSVGCHFFPGLPRLLQIDWHYKEKQSISTRHHFHSRKCLSTTSVAMHFQQENFNQNSLFRKSDLGVIPYCYFYGTVGAVETICKRVFIQHMWIIIQAYLCHTDLEDKFSLLNLPSRFQKGTWYL